MNASGAQVGDEMAWPGDLLPVVVLLPGVTLRCVAGSSRVAEVGGRAGLAAFLLIRPDEVLSCIFDVPILKVANHSLRRLLQHCHVRCGRLA